MTEVSAVKVLCIFPTENYGTFQAADKSDKRDQLFICTRLSVFIADSFYELFIQGLYTLIKNIQYMLRNGIKSAVGAVNTTFFDLNLYYL